MTSLTESKLAMALSNTIAARITRTTLLLVLLTPTLFAHSSSRAQEGVSPTIYELPGIVVKGYRRVGGLVYPDVQVVACYGDKVLFGTSGAGLCVYDQSDDAWYVMDETRGLSNNSVTALAYQPGHLWIGTSSGLNHYDERNEQWTYFTRKDGLPSDQITALAMVPGLLVVGTEKGLAACDLTNDTWWSHPWLKRINCLAVDAPQRKEVVWVGTDQGVWISHPDGRTLPLARSMVGPGNQVEVNETPPWLLPHNTLVGEPEARGLGTRAFRALAGDKVQGIAIAGEQVWIVTPDGTSLYDRTAALAKDAWHTFLQNKMSREWGSPHWTDMAGTVPYLVEDFVHEHVACVEGLPNYVWVGTIRGCLMGSVFSDNTVAWGRLEDEGLGARHVKAMAQDGSGNLWIGTAGGAFMLHTVSGRLTRLPEMVRLTSGQVKDVLVRDRYAYVATFGGGLNIHDGKTYQWSSITKMDGAGSDFLTALAEHRGKLWLASFGGGVTSFDPATGAMRVYTRKQGLLSNTVSDVAAFDGKLWFATPKGLSVFDPDQERWHAYVRGTLIPVGARPQPAPVARSVDETNVLALDRTGRRLWVVMEHTLGFIERADSLVFRPFALPDTGDPRPLSCITDTHQALWIGQGSRIIRFDRNTRKWGLYDQDKGLGSGQVKSLTVCKGHLWAATHAGLYRYNPEADRWRLFAEEDGLRVKEVQAVSAWGPLLLIGGRNGASLYHVQEEWWQNFVFTDYFGALGSNDVGDVIADSQYVWFATYGAGIARYDKRDQVWSLFTEADGLPSNVVAGLDAEPGAVKAVFYDGSVARFDRHYGAWQPVAQMQDAETLTEQNLPSIGPLPEQLSWDDVQASVKDSVYVWLATRKGVWRQHITHQFWKHYAGRPHLCTDEIRAVASDNWNLWLGTAGCGVARFNRVLRKWQRFDVGKQNLVTVVVPDASDLWVAVDSTVALVTQEGGTARRLSNEYNLLRYRILDIEPLPRYNAIWVVTSEGASFAPFELFGRLLEGSRVQTRTTLHDFLSPPIGVRRVGWWGLLDQSRPEWDRFWRGMDRNPLAFRIAGWAQGEHLRSQIETQYRAFNPWKNYSDVPEIRKDYKSPEREPALAGREATGVVPHRGGILSRRRVWISTSGGLTELSPDENRWGRDEQLDGVRINTMIADSLRVCCGTADGLYVYDRTKNRWNRWTASDGLADDFVLSIACINDEIWVATPSGVSVCRPRDGVVNSFTQSDGMSTDYAGDVTVSGQFVWVAHPSNGLSRYDREGGTWTVFRAADGVPHYDEGR